MSNGSQSPSMMAPAAGVVVGVATFVLANFVAGRAIIPSVESVTDPQRGLSQPVYASEEVAATDAAPQGAYQTICQSCHQADGKGVAGAFPPLAGSEWLTGDPETPVRIAILGLTGPIEVAGTTYNSTMPPPAGITDEQIVEAVNFARTNFGNKASEIDVDLVKKVRAEIGARTDSWTAAELTALRGAAVGAEEEPAADAGMGGAPAEAEAPAEEGAAEPTEAAPAEAPAAADAPAEEAAE